MKPWIVVAALSPFVLLSPVFAGNLLPTQELEALPRIVNGLETQAIPEVVALHDDLGNTICSGTIIGCNHVLTAAHCVCGGQTAASCGTPSPGAYNVFSQSLGSVGVSSISVNPDYFFALRGDLAILELDTKVTGIDPAEINDTARVAPGSTALIAGYGLSQGGGNDSGLHRYGLVETSTCTNVDDDEHVCWTFTNPLGAAGEDSNTCSGDSGGPLFASVGGQTVVAGATSGGAAFDCLADDASFDADVHANRTWIQSIVGSDLGGGSCVLPGAGSPGTSLLAGADTLETDGQATFSFDVPDGTSVARVTLNGEDGSGFIPNDFDLYVSEGHVPTTDDFDCRSWNEGNYEGCELMAPAPGTYNILVDAYAGAGDFQTTVTLFGSDVDGCIPSDTAMCLNEGRFKVEVEWKDFAGETGPGSVVDGGSDDSGLFWFFNPDNWEQLIKVINGCNINGHYWVFAAATTNVEYTITVTDTQEGVVQEYFNPLGNQAAAITDTSAFATCP